MDSVEFKFPETKVSIEQWTPTCHLFPESVPHTAVRVLGTPVVGWPTAGKRATGACVGGMSVMGGSATPKSALSVHGGDLETLQARRERVAALGASVAHTAHTTVLSNNTGLVADGGFPRVLSVVSGRRT
ncbi:hypothetical protein [Actinokineospora pegani]|uniref:hypothetical protein n=1 Tax=Actinokineospora pegani TaxID=2654637 RepID=UPI0012EAEF31|nr:hypothetical protein [Actinokineospora pegani]